MIPFFKKSGCLLLFLISAATAAGQIFTEINTGMDHVRNSAVAWGDADNDGDLDLLLTGYGALGPVTKLYLNNGNDNFSEHTGFSFEGVSNGSVDWGDYNNDGYLDIILTGVRPSFFTAVYENNGDGTFSEQSTIPLPGIGYGDAKWGDYDNDGDLDLILIGSDRFGKIYRNQGNNHFQEQTGIILPEMNNSQCAWEDIDRDGDLDILVTGRSFYDGKLSRIYENNGDHTFSEMISLTGIENGEGSFADMNSDGFPDLFLSGDSLDWSPFTRIYKNIEGSNMVAQPNTVPHFLESHTAWGDADHDGAPDLFVSGRGELGHFSGIFLNEENFSFKELTDENFVQAKGDIAWGDHDNDGDLDLILTGSEPENALITRLYKNNIATPNILPGNPLNPVSQVHGNSVTLSWERSSDFETPATGLTYELYIDTLPGGKGIRSPHSMIPSGYRKVARTGCIRDTFWTIRDLEAGTYYWGVQSIDNNFAGSPFSAEQQFTITFDNEITPDQAQEILPDTDGITLTVTETEAADSRQWKTSNFPGGPYDFILEGETGTSYTPRFSDFNNYYVVCVSTKNGTDILSNEVLIDIPQFTCDSSIELMMVSGTAIAWADYDSDHDLDFILTGMEQGMGPRTVLYNNNGSGGFSEVTGLALTDVMNGSLGWSDVDHDGDADLLLSGEGTDGPVSKVYRNEGDGSFTEIAGAISEGYMNCAAVWIDHDRNGDPDILIAGETTDGQQRCDLYRNDGNGQFVKITSGIVPFSDGAMAVADYDGDRDPDVAVSGKDFSGNLITKIYANDGNDHFSDTEIKLTGVNYGNLAWCDYDQDGDPDLAVTGEGEVNSTAIYRNDGGNNFTEQVHLRLAGVHCGSLAWGDYDNDGDADLLLTGRYASEGSKTFFYLNEGNDQFSEQGHIDIEGTDMGMAAWANFDDDTDLDLLVAGTNDWKSFIYRNNNTIQNTLPETPVTQGTVRQGSSATIQWLPATDNETPSAGLTYNVVVSISKDSLEIITPLSDLQNGYRQIPAMGNAGYDTSFTICNLDTGKYYWRVQSVDPTFAGSAFSEPDSFTILPPFTDIQAGLKAMKNGSADWVDYNGDGNLDILLTGAEVDEEWTETAFTRLYKNNGDQSFTLQDTPLPDIYSGEADWGDFDNDGDMDLALIGKLEGSYSNDATTVVYAQNSDNTFPEEPCFTFPGGGLSFLSWGDADNDGDLDLLMVGENYVTDIHNLEINQRDNGFTNGNLSIHGLFFIGGSIKWGDYDNDLDLDILVAGTTQNGYKTLVLQNQRKNNFEVRELIQLPGICDGVACWHDSDNDGDLDIFMTGEGEEGKFTALFRNDGGDVFTEVATGLRGISSCSVHWGDYDNDGDPDILVTGKSGTEITAVFENEGNNVFTETAIGLPGCQQSNATWGDYDNDGDLDILLTGTIGNDWELNPVSGVYRNNKNIANEPPSPPANLQVERSGYGLFLSWAPSSDDHTPSAALSYNLRMGTRSRGTEIISPASDSLTGKTFIPEMGNCQHNTGWRIDSLAEGTYYWSVQAIDQAYAGSGWSEEQTFTISIVRADFKADTACFGKPTIFTDKTLTSGDPVTAWEWDFGDGEKAFIQNPVHTYATADTFQVELIAISPQYSDTIIKAVIVLPGPVTDFTADLVCQGTETTFINETTVSQTEITSWDWDFGDGHTSDMEGPLQHGYLNADNYQVRLTATAINGCVDTTEKIVVVESFPSNVVSVDGSLQFCSGESRRLSAVYKPEYSYSWMRDGVAITGSDSSDYMVTETGSYRVLVTNTNGNCSNTSDSYAVSVDQTPPAPVITYSGATEFCDGDSLELSVTDNPELTYHWKLNGGAIGYDQNTLVAKSNGTYEVEVTNEAGCSILSHNEVEITVHPTPPAPLLDDSGTMTLCEDDEMKLGITNYNEQYNYNWTRNGTSLETGNAQIDITAAGLYQVVSGNEFSCSSNSEVTDISIIALPPAPLVEFTEGSSLVCPEEEVRLEITNSSPSFDYQWVENGTPQAGATQTGYSPVAEGIYRVLASDRGCSTESAPLEITYKDALPRPEIMAEGPVVWYLACSNDSAELYRWYREDIMVDQGEEHIFVAGERLGKYHVEISADGECFTSSDVISIPENVIIGVDENIFGNLKIYPNPTPGMFTLEMDNPVMGELIIDIFEETGKMILNIKFHKEISHFKTQIDLSGQPSGTYLIVLMLENASTTRLLMVE